MTDNISVALQPGHVSRLTDRRIKHILLGGSKMARILADKYITAALVQPFIIVINII